LGLRRSAGALCTVDDALHRGGADLFFAGHIHVYQRFFPLRTGPYGPNASRPNNEPADIDFACASTEAGPDYAHEGLIANNTYTNPRCRLAPRATISADRPTAVRYRLC
jgi:hypothetical protein